MLTKALFVASAAAGASAVALSNAHKESLKAHCKADTKKGNANAKHLQLWQRLKKSIPGAGVDLEKVKGDFKAGKSWMDGFSHVTCINEGMRTDANLHEDPNRYGAQFVNVSVVYYDTLVASEDRVPMTTGVCFNFCRKLEHMNFFGLNNGRGCYCTPYYKAKAGGEDQICDAPCDGNPATMCGGRDKSDVYEMHLCEDMDDDLETALDKLKNWEGQFMYEQFNLEESAKIMEHIADITKFYGKVGGDVLTGNQMMAAKKLVGKAVGLLNEGKKYSKQAKELLGKLGAKENEWDMSEGKKNEDAAWMKEAEDDMVQSSQLTPVLRKYVEEMKPLRTFMHETTGGNTTDRIAQYFPVTHRQFLGVQESHKNKEEMDSVCNSKAEIMRYVVSNEGDCAYMCDKALHPSKCVAYQYYPLMEFTAPTVSEWDWCRGQAFTPSGGDTDEFCHKVQTPVTPQTKYVIKSGGYKDYVDFSRHGPFTLTIKPNAECEHIDFWDIGTGVMYLHKADANSKVITKKTQTGVEMGHGGGMWEESSEDDDFKRVSEMTFEFKEEKYYSLYTWYGKECANVELEIKSPEAVPKTGVCALLADVNEVSYYTCPDDMKADAEDVNMAGQNARCMLKESENKGFVAKNLKTLTENKRCMVEKREEFPKLEIGAAP